MGELSKYPNIGKKVEEQLNQVGINTFEDLKKIGAKASWLRIQEIDKEQVIKGTDQAIYESEQEILNGAEAIDAEVFFTNLEKKYFE